MALKRTQIYLDPEEHRRLVREAAERGISLTEHIRRVIADRAGESAPAYEVATWDRLFAITDSGAKDTVEDMDIEAGEAFDEQHGRSAG